MGATVVIAEDAFIVREGVRMLLEEAGYDIKAAVESYDELLEAVNIHSPDVVITDIRMPPTRTDEGVRAAIEIRESHPSTGVVVLSQYVEPDYATKLFAAGADGLAYLLKERLGDLDQFEHAIDEVRNGRSVIDPRVVDALVEGRTRPASTLERLTDREIEVMSEIAKGKTNAAIADTLFLSERAIEKHINSIFTKLDLLPEKETNRRVSAVLLFLAEGGTER
ncbi:MAG: response regulator transcription factor [Acidimicrobiia bacterium]